MTDAVVFDLDGVLVDSEGEWDRARRELAEECGGRWHERASTDMLGMSAPEWSAYMRDELAVGLEANEIDRRVVERVLAGLRRGLPLLPGAVEAVERLAAEFPLGLASSANRAVIDAVLDLSGMARRFRATASSEEVQRGKPSPDVYLAVAEALGVDARRTVAVEDSANGIRSAHAAGMAVVAWPNPHFPPAEEALDLAALVIDSLDELSVDAVRGLGARDEP